jgi:hypothetical protein
MSDKQLTRAARYGKTRRKTITLTSASRLLLEQYAAEHNLPFSAAIEWLVKRGQINEVVKRMTAAYDSRIDTILTIARTAANRRYDMQATIDQIEDRYGKTSRKHVTLTNDAIEMIEMYASFHDVTFSVAVETLAVLGLNGEASRSLSRVLAGMVDSILSRYLEHQATLSAQAVQAVEEANTKIDFLVLQTFWREARQNPERFEEEMGVSTSDNDQPDRRVRELQHHIKELAQAAGVERLRRHMVDDEAKGAATDV